MPHPSSPRVGTSAGISTGAVSSTWLRCASTPTYPASRRGASVPAAGLPWFMALFGRDSLVTSYQALPLAPELAKRHCGSSLPFRPPSLTGSATKSQARSSTSYASASSPNSVSGLIHPTTARPTPLRCSSCSWTRWSVGPATISSSGSWNPTPAPRCGGSTTTATSTLRRLRGVPASQRGHRPGEHVLEGLVELDPVRRRHQL